MVIQGLNVARLAILRSPVMRRILNQAVPALSVRSLPASLAVGAAVFMLFVVAGASGTVRQVPAYAGEMRDEVELLGSPTTQGLTSSLDVNVREIRIQRGDTVAGLLSGADIRDAELLDFLRRNRETEQLFRQLVPGRTITLSISASGELRALVFPLNGGKDKALSISRSLEGLTAEIKSLQTEPGVTLQTATINHSLYGAADDAGIPDAITNQLADIFGGDIDFHRDLRKGDRFSVIYETASHLGRPIRIHRILAAEFINDGKTLRAFWYEDKDRVGGYYTQNGNSVRKAFLRSPLEFSRISSGFSAARYHPVLQEIRAHRGIDYAAAAGTRVRATGDGVIELAGNQGGYGKVVMIRHAGDKTTVYGHLSGFAPNIRKGARVAQGDVIGFVGSTGLATGPHLHYEFRVAGAHRNPLSVILPSAAPLAQAVIPEFHAHAEQQLTRIAEIRNAQMLMLD